MSKTLRSLLNAIAVCVAALTVPVLAQDAPAAPYWSVELGRHASREQALAQIKSLPATDALRAEKRAHGWYVRAGAWRDKAQAERAQKDWAKRGVKARHGAAAGNQGFRAHLTRRSYTHRVGTRLATTGRGGIRPDRP